MINRADYSRIHLIGEHVKEIASFALSQNEYAELRRLCRLLKSAMHEDRDFQPWLLMDILSDE